MAPGKVVQVIGTVVDVEFPADELPNLFDALDLDNVGEKLVLEVQQHIGNNWVRCLALGATDGLARGVEVNDTIVAVDERLIGGYKLEQGGKLLDNSFKAKLLQIYRNATKA